MTIDDMLNPTKANGRSWSEIKVVQLAIVSVCARTSWSRSCDVEIDNKIALRAAQLDII